MSKPVLEHVNLTVQNPEKTAQMLVDLFDWNIRWQGPSLDYGRTVHVGLEDFYLALYSPRQVDETKLDNYVTVGALNHIAVLVDDIDKAEQRIVESGYRTHNHADYEPGRRFYFNDHDGIEYEVVSYTA